MADARYVCTVTRFGFMWGKYVSVMLASMLKFIGGPLAGAALNLPWYITALCTAVGMMLSVVAVVYAGAVLQTLISRFRKKPPRRFTRRTRLAVRVWKRFGLAGIAFLTPLILTPIGGTTLAMSFRVARTKIIIYMLISALAWGVIQSFALYSIPGLKGLLGH